MADDAHLFARQNELLGLSRKIGNISEVEAGVSAAALAAMLNRLTEIEIELVGILIVASARRRPAPLSPTKL